MRNDVRFALFVLLLVVIACVRSLTATRLDGFTIDEPYHINAGVAYVTRGDYRLNPEQPPLVKLWVGAFEAPSFKLPPFRPIVGKIAERDFHESAVFIANNADAVQQRARLAMILFHMLALIAFAFAARRVFGDVVAIGALLFLVIDPTIAAHMPVVMTDLPVAIWSAIAMLCAIAAFRSWRVRDAALAALALGCALGAKHNGIIAAGAVALVGIAMARVDKKKLALVAAVLLGAVIVLWAQYRFHYFEGGPFNKPLTQKIADLHTPAFRSLLTFATSAHLLPRAYIWGLADILRAGVEGRAYPFTLFGHTFIGTTPAFYFPAIVAVKVPIALLLLSIAGVVAASRERNRDGAMFFVLPLLFFAALMTSNSGYAGVRHALTIYFGLAILTGMALAAAWQSRNRSQLAAAGACVIVAAIVAIPIVRPWEFFNSIGGGDDSYRQFSDEGTDLGQRSNELASFYRANVARSGMTAYDVYGLLDRDRERRHLDIKTWSDAPDGTDTKLRGWFFIRAGDLSTDAPWADYTPFRAARPVARFGNLLVYRGTFDLPWVRAINQTYRAAMLMHATAKPDLAEIETLATEAARLDPRAYPIHILLGNIRAKRGHRDDAVRAFTSARSFVLPGDPLLARIDAHIARLRMQPPERVPELVNPWSE